MELSQSHAWPTWTPWLSASVSSFLTVVLDSGCHFLAKFPNNHKWWVVQVHIWKYYFILLLNRVLLALWFWWSPARNLLNSTLSWNENRWSFSDLDWAHCKMEMGYGYFVLTLMETWECVYTAPKNQWRSYYIRGSAENCQQFMDNLFDCFHGRFPGKKKVLLSGNDEEGTSYIVMLQSNWVLIERPQAPTYCFVFQGPGREVQVCGPWTLRSRDEAARFWKEDFSALFKDESTSEEEDKLWLGPLIWLDVDTSTAYVTREGVDDPYF